MKKLLLIFNEDFIKIFTVFFVLDAHGNIFLFQLQIIFLIP